MKNIIKTNIKGVEYFFIRVQREQIFLKKYIKIQDFESERKAFHYAIKVKEELLQQLGNKRLSRQGQPTRPNTTTGVIGVHTQVKRSGDNEYLYYIASYYKNKKCHTKIFSAGNVNAITPKKKHSAFIKACEFRRAAVD